MMNPAQNLLAWLTAQAGFPGRRLPSSAELLLCFAAAANEAEESESQAGGMVQRHDPATRASQKAHALRRSQVHYKCDNSAKV